MSNDLQLKLTLKATDQGLSGVVRETKREVAQLDSSLNSVSKTTGHYSDKLNSADKAAGRFYDQMGRLREANGRFVTGAKRATEQTERFKGTLAGTSRGVSGLTAVLGGLASALSIREVIQYSDSYTLLQNQLVDVTGSMEDLTGINAQLDAVAEESRASLSSTVNLYARLSRATSEMGLSQEQLIQTTETINKAFALSGATVQETDAAIVQLSQGLAAGALRGDEFNSVAEQAPEIMRSIASHLNMTIGELRDFAAEGGITAEIVVDALDEAATAIDDRFGNSVATFGQRVQEAKDNLMEFIGTSGDVQSLSTSLGNGIVTLSQNLGTIVQTVKVVGTLAAGYWAVNTAIKAATAAQVAFNVATMANPIGIVAKGLAIAGTALATYVVAADAGTHSVDDLTTALDSNTAAIHQNANASSLSAKDQIKASIAAAEAQITTLQSTNTATQSTIEALKQQQLQFRDNAEMVASYAINITTALLSIETNKDRIDELNTSIGKMNKTLDGFSSGSVANATDANLKLIDSYARQIPRVEKLSQDLEKLQELQIKYPGHADKITLAIANINRQLKEEANRTSKKIGQNEKLIDSLEDELKLLNLTGLARDIEINQRKLAADATEQQRQQVIELTKQIYNQKQVSDQSQQAASPWADAWSQSAERIDGVFAETWTGAFDGFEDFSDEMLNSFGYMLAEMGHLAATKPILLSFRSEIGNALGITGGNQTGSSFDYGNALSVGKSIFSGNSFGAAISDSLDGLLYDSQGFSTWLGDSFLGDTLSSISDGYANMSNLSSLGSLGAGFVGGKLADVFGLSGKYSGVTSTIGSAVGTGLGASSLTSLGSFAGPVGALAGAFLGSAIGGLFGGDDLPPGLEFKQYRNGAGGYSSGGGPRADHIGFFDQNREYAAVSRFGAIGVGTNDAEDQAADIAKQYSSVIDSLVAFEDRIASTLTAGQISSISGVFDSQVGADNKSIISMSRESGQSVTDFIEHRLDVIFDGIGGELNDLFDQFTGDASDAQAYAAALIDINTAISSDGLLSTFLPDNLTATVNAMAGLGLEGETLGDTFTRVSTGAAYLYQNLWTEQERAEHTVERLNGTLGELNTQFGTSIQSTDDLKQFVNALDLTGESGQHAYNAAIQLAPVLLGLEEAMTLTTAAAEEQRKQQERITQSELAALERDKTTAKNALVNSLENEISTLVNAQQQLVSSADAARNNLIGAYQRSIQKATSAQSQLESNFAAASSGYEDAINRQIDRQAALRDNALELAETWRTIADQLADSRSSIVRGALSGSNAQAYDQQQFNSLIQQAWNGELSAFEQLPGAAQNYQNTLRGQTASGAEFRLLSAEIAAQLQSVESHAGSKETEQQRIAAASERTVKSLERQLESIQGVERAILSIAEARDAYESAQTALDSSSHAQRIFYYNAQVSRLQNVSAGIQSLTEAQATYADASAALEASNHAESLTALNAELDELKDTKKSIVDLDTARAEYERASIALVEANHRSELSVLQSQLQTLESINNGQSTLAASLAERVALPKFSNGGIASGPTSGYAVELHGTEAVIPLKNGSVPVQMHGSGNSDALIRQLIAEVERLRQDTRAVNAEQTKASIRMANLMKRWNKTGLKVNA